MAFPATKRVVYQQNPLAEVIGQLRFPPILRIETEVPAAFQEQIRAKYPLLREGPSLTIPESVSNDLAKLVAANLSQVQRTSREFISADGKWKVSLTRDFLALTTTTYERWEEFRGRLQDLVESLVRVYAPPFYTRVGLRYKDVIERSSLGLLDRKWSQLLRGELLGALAARDLADDVVDTYQTLTVRLADERDSHVRLTHGLVIKEDPGNKEIGYLIDADFFTTQRVEVHDAFQVLDLFNRHSGRLFRWCIRDDLHHAMVPRDIDQ